MQEDLNLVLFNSLHKSMFAMLYNCTMFNELVEKRELHMIVWMKGSVARGRGRRPGGIPIRETVLKKGNS